MHTLTTTLTTTLTWLAANPIAVAAAIVLVTAVIAALAWWLTRTLRTTVKATARTVRTKTNLVMAGIAALLASSLSAEGMWRFMGHDLQIHGPARAVFFAFFEFLMFAFAILSRSHRIRQIKNRDSHTPPTMGSDGLGVWLVAILIGYFAASDAATTPAAVARFAVPLAAAWMWERALIGELADKAGVDPALVRTTIRRAAAATRRTIRRAADASQRVLARVGLIAPTGQTAVEAVEARWITKLVRIHIAMTAAAESDREERSARLAARYRRHVMRANALGILTSPPAQQRLVEAIARVDRATEAIDRSRLRSIEVWGITTDRPVEATEWTIYTIDTPNERPTDRPNERPTDTPNEGGIVPPSIEPPAPTDRLEAPSTDRTTPTNAIEPPTPLDRPERPKRRTKEENEQIVIESLRQILGAADEVPFPSQGEIARIGQISKSTVGGYLGREDISKEPLLTRDLIHQLTHK